MKKILIIDDNADVNHLNTGISFLNQLPDSLKQLFDLMTNLSNAVRITDQHEISLSFPENEYLWVFFHDSFRDKFLDESQLSDLKGKFKNMITFSGGIESIGYHVKATSRELLFSRLEEAAAVYAETGHFPVKYLCNNNAHKYYVLIDHLLQLIDQNKKDLFLNSKELKFLLKKLNYSELDIATGIIPSYEKMSIDDLFEKIENWKFKRF
ncbi:MAG: hypothetical protein RBR84_08570 [Bacteroidales bacterium]|jgi:hypothetical protein|nr:hypothetical protein [Prolixibacteraceae bacterium]MDY0085953.1 hypothetical protein [Bacteroidales bacterium]